MRPCHATSAPASTREFRSGKEQEAYVDLFASPGSHAPGALEEDHTGSRP